MKVHLVSEHASPLALIGSVDAGGQNVHVAALAGSLAHHGADVVVHTRRDDPSLDRRVQFSPGIVIDHVDSGPPEPIPKDELADWMGEFADDLVAQWRRDRPDIVHAHFWMSGMAAVMAAQRVDVPVVITYHALGAEKRRHHGVLDTSPTGRLAVEDWLARGVDHVIATTAQEAATVVDMGAMPAAVSVIPCGVDLDLFRPDGPSWPARRHGVRRVVCVSRLVPRKGIADVVAALTELPDTELLVAGGPPEAMLSEDSEALSLWESAARLGVDDRVELLGALDRRDVPALMRSADVVACCPWYEPFGLVAVEAMACGIPVVATDVGGLGETVLHGRTGLHVEARSPGSIAAAVRHITGEDGDWSAMSRAARRRGAAYGWDRVGAGTLAVYERVIRGGRKCFDEEVPPLHEAPLSAGGRPTIGDPR